MDAGHRRTTMMELSEFLNGQVPDAAIVLGSGMGSQVDSLFDSMIGLYPTVQTSAFKYWPQPTVEGHAGMLYFGKIGDKKVLAISGRVHYYEGCPMDEVTFYVRVLSMLGVKSLFLTCATGSTGVAGGPRTGDIRVIGDHINMLPNPLIGPNLDEFGPRFVDMSQPYDPELTSFGVQWLRGKFGKMNPWSAASFNSVTLLGLTGPTFETKAEYNMGARLGADVVGMSTVPEVIVANHCGMRVFASTIVTDNPAEKVSHEEVQRVAAEKAPIMAAMISHVIHEM